MESKRCQYLNTSVTNVGTKRNFWKKAAARKNTFVKNVEVQICGSFFQAFPSGRVARAAIHAQPERVQPGPVDFDRKDF
jgi:hypothetical protein